MSTQEPSRSSRVDEDNMTPSTGGLPLLLDVKNAAKKASEIRRANVTNLLLMSSIFLFQNAAFSVYVDDVIIIWRSPTVDFWWFVSRACFFPCYIISCVFAPVLLDRLLDTRKCLLLGGTSIPAIIVAQMVPRPYTLIPVSLWAGLTLPLYFTAQGSWLTICSHRFACPLGVNLGVNETPEAYLTSFHGVFNAAFLSGILWRSLLNLGILDGTSTLGPDNTSHCGFYHCLNQLDYSSSNTTADSHRKVSVEALLGTYLTLALAGVLLLVFCFTSPVQTRDTENLQPVQRSIFRTICGSSAEHYLLWAFLGLVLGLVQYFIYNVFPVVLLSGCHTEAKHVWLIITVSGVTSLFSMFGGCFTRWIGRFKLIVLSAVIFISLSVTLLVVNTNKMRLEIIFIIGGILAVADAIWQTQVSALLSIRYYGVKRSAFSSYRLWQMVGLMLGFFLSKIHCGRYVVYLLIATVVATMVTFISLEIRLRLWEVELRQAGGFPGDSQHTIEEVDDATWVPTLDPFKQRQRAALVNIPFQQK